MRRKVSGGQSKPAKAKPPRTNLPKGRMRLPGKPVPVRELDTEAKKLDIVGLVDAMERLRGPFTGDESDPDADQGADDDDLDEATTIET